MQQLQELYQKCMEGTASETERETFLTLMADDVHHQDARLLIQNTFTNSDGEPKMPAASADLIFKTILNAAQLDNHAGAQRVVHRVHFLKTAWFRYAAAIILIMTGVAVYFASNRNQSTNNPIVQQKTKTSDIAPGFSRAVLTLSDGKKVTLDSAASETIIDQTLSIENKDGQLLYSKSDLSATNTMTTPNGGQYQLTLSDGTKVWLNAASSITYPTAFNGKTREVSVTGEAYFEVKSNAKQPFIVKTNTDEITVLGTAFNINAYPDETNVKTSLAEGRVKVNGSVLKPGEAFINGKIVKTDIVQDIAWKNGYFNFNGTPLPAVMRQLEKWYDISVKYEGNIPTLELVGEMQRELTLQQVLEVLKEMNVQHRIEGRTLIIQ